MNARACPLPGELTAYAQARPGPGADGADGLPAGTGDESRRRVEAHLAECADCRLRLAAWALQQAPETGLESATLDRLAAPPGLAAELLREMERREAPAARSAVGAGGPAGRLSVDPPASAPADPPRSAVSRKPRWARAGAIAVATAAAAVLALTLRPEDPRRVLADAQGDARPLEAMLSEVPYAPYAPSRGQSDPEARYDKPLRKLLEAQEKQRPDSARRLATLYSMRRGPGDAQRAERLLAQAGNDADSENDRAVLLFAQGDLLAALEAVDRALEDSPRHRPARFNRALLLSRLGFDARAGEAFEALSHDDPSTPFAAEARERASRARAAPASAGPAPAQERRDAARALLGADSPETLAQAKARIARLPEGVAQDLSRMAEVASHFSSEQLAGQARLFARYQALRGETVAGHDAADAALALVRDAEGSPLVLVPALQLAAFRSYWAGELRQEQELQLRVLHLCRQTGCDAVSEAIAADELAEMAGRDGDFTEAHRLQDRAEALFVSVAAELQLGELQLKRAHLFVAEDRLPEATQAAVLALRTLAPLRSPEALAARATAANVAGAVAVQRKLLRAGLELHQGGLSLVDEVSPGFSAADVSAALASAVAVDQAELGRLPQARPVLDAEIARQLAAGHKLKAAEVRETAAALALRAGDAAGALSQATEALAGLPDGAGALGSSETAQKLHVERARALLRVNGPPALPEARRELEAALAQSRKDIAGATEPQAKLLLARKGAATAVELAALGQRAGAPAEELLLPLESLRELIFAPPTEAQPISESRAAAGSRTAALGADFHAKLGEGRCLLALLPADETFLRVAITQAGGVAEPLATSRAQLEALVASAKASRPAGVVPDPRAPTPAEQTLASTLFNALPAACADAGELWLWSEAPLDRFDLTALPLPKPLDRAAAGMVNSLARLLAPAPAWPPAETLLADGAEVRGEDADAVVALPAAARERTLLASLLHGGLLELTGAALTPTALLARLPTARLLHAAVHGAEGPSDGSGSLQLSGELGRLRVGEIAGAKLPAGSRVILSACHASPGESGLSIAFARAGALEVAAAEGAIDDAAAARWAEAFYPALAQGQSFVKANQTAIRAASAVGPRAWFVVSR